MKKKAPVSCNARWMTKEEENEEDEDVEIHFWEFVTNNSGQSRPFISLFYNFTIIFRFQWMNGLKIAQNVSSI